MVDRTARRLARLLPDADVDELRSCGWAALIRAARRYDPARGVLFSSFARHRVKGAMLDVYRSEAPANAPSGLTAKATGRRAKPDEDARERLVEKHVVGIATAQMTGVMMQLGLDSEGAFVAISPAIGADDAAERAEVLALLERSINSLPADEALVVRRHWLQGIPVERLARELGLTRGEARHLHDRGYERLQRRLTRRMQSNRPEFDDRPRASGAASNLGSAPMSSVKSSAPEVRDDAGAKRSKADGGRSSAPLNESQGEELARLRREVMRLAEQLEFSKARVERLEFSRALRFGAVKERAAVRSGV